VAAAIGPFDYVLSDWREARLRFASALKPVLFTLDPTRVVYTIRTLSAADLAQIDQRLRCVLAL
jgi:hypothetical protein